MYICAFVKKKKKDGPSGGSSMYKGPAVWRSSAHLETKHLEC